MNTPMASAETISPGLLDELIKHLVEKQQVKQIRLSLAITEFLVARGLELSHHTVRDYTLTLKRLRDHVAPDDPLVHEITASVLREFLATVPGEKKNRKNAHTCLSAFYTFVTSEGYGHEHLPRKIKMPKPQRRNVIPLTLEEVKRLLETAKSSGRDNSRNTAILMTLLDGGLRASELTNLLVSDLKDGILNIRLGKGDKDRLVPLSENTLAAINTYLAERGTPKNVESTKAVIGAYLTENGTSKDAEKTLAAFSEYLTAHNMPKGKDPLFLSECGGPLDRYSLRSLLLRLGNRAGVKNPHPHKFRHTFAINYLLNGGDVYTLQRILGHADLAMTQRYLNIAQADIQGVHKKASPIGNWGIDGEKNK